MLGLGGKKNRRGPALVEASPLRAYDPRTKIFLATGASLAVMLPLERLVIFLVFYLLLFIWAKLLPQVLEQVWRIRWVLLALFVLDWWVVNLDLAIIVTLRLMLLASVFTLVFSTTTPVEFSQALERLKSPYRYAFSLTLAFQSLDMMGEEWQAIQEAQKARGVYPQTQGFRQLVRQIREFIVLTVPAIVLTTKRAWYTTEAAYARGFDSPHRRPYRVLKLQLRDWLVIGVSIVAAVFFLWR
jgi:energy-coupling factor transport system permease protein